MAVAYHPPGTPMPTDPNQQQWVQDTGRESYHYATVPEAYKNIPGFMGVANDPSQDPGAFAQNYLTQQRSQGITDGSDAAALSGQGFLGGAPPSALPKNATPAQQWNAQPAPPMATAAPTAPSVLPSVPKSAASSGQDALFQQLMERARQGTAVDRNDPNIRSQVDPYVAQQTRASRDYLADAAERQGPLGNIAGEARMASERLGQNAGLFESELIGREIDSRRQEISEALQLAQQMGNSSAVLELQSQLALLQDQSRSADRSLQAAGMTNDYNLAQQGMSQDYGLAQQGYGLQRQGIDLQRQGQRDSMEQFMRELALREWQYGDQSDLNWAQLGG